jgi:hypothetical protein
MAYLGSFTVAGSIPGASAVLDEVGGALAALNADAPAIAAALDAVGTALANLHATVAAQLSIIGNAAASIQAEIDALAAAKIAIRIPAIADFQAQLNAALDISASFSAQLSDPAAYVSGLLTGLAEVQANLGVLLPQFALETQIASSAVIAAGFAAKIGAVDLQLEALVTIGAALQVVVDGLLAVQAALSAAISAASAALSIYVGIAAQLASFQAAISAALPALDAYATLTGLMAAAGVHVFMFEELAGDLAAAVDAELPSAGIGAGVAIRVPVIVIEASNTAASNGIDATFRVS